MVATKGHVCREPGQINYGQAPPFISTNMGSWRTPLNSNRDGFSVYPQFIAASCCIQRGPRSSKLMCTLRGKSKWGAPLEIFQLHGVPPLRGWVYIYIYWMDTPICDGKTVIACRLPLKPILWVINLKRIDSSLIFSVCPVILITMAVMVEIS